MGISKMPRLHYHYIDRVGYSLTNSSSYLAVGFLPVPFDPQDINTNNFREYSALGNLERQVNANRAAAGLAPLPPERGEYQHVEKEAFEYYFDLEMEGDDDSD